MDRRTRLVPIATTIHGPSALGLANARKSNFHSSLRCSITKCFAQLGDRTSGQASNIGSVLEKRKEIFKKILVVVVHVVGVRKKSPVTERSFQRDLQDMVETKSPRA